MIGVVTAAHTLVDHIEPIRTDYFIRLYKMGRRQTKRHLRDETCLYYLCCNYAKKNTINNFKN